MHGEIERYAEPVNQLPQIDVEADPMMNMNAAEPTGVQKSN